jgi:phage terminase large subunit
MNLNESDRLSLINGVWGAWDITDAMVYKTEYQQILKENRISTVRYQPGHTVYAAFDLGFGDYTSIIIFQICGKEYHILESFENNGILIDWYAEQIKAKGYKDAEIILPHDAKQHSLQTGYSMEEKMKQFFSTVHVLPRIGIEDGISTTKTKLPYFWIDKTNNSALIDSIINYERAYNPKIDMYGEPIHNKYSHMADALRYTCLFTIHEKLILDIGSFGFTSTF